MIINGILSPLLSLYITVITSISIIIVCPIHISSIITNLKMLMVRMLLLKVIILLYVTNYSKI